MRRWTAVAVMAASALAFTGPALARGRTLAATDILVAGPPYRERVAAPIEVRNTLQVDQAEQMPLVAEFWRSAREGRLQRWEPDVGGGVPLFTGVYNRVLAPWFVTFLFVPAALAPTVAVALALFVAQLGAYALARRIGLSVAAATLAGVAYGFSGPATSMINRVHELFLFPALLWAIHGAVTGPRRGRFAAAAAVTTGLVWFSGFPAAALFVLYAAGAWLAHLSWKAPGGMVRAAFPAALALVAGTLVAAVQILPSVEFLRSSGALERTFETTDRVGIVSLASSASGRFFGAYQDHDWWGTNRDANPVEASSTMGLVALGLVGALAAGRRLRATDRAEHVVARFFLPAGLLVAAATYLGGPALWLVHRLPYMQNNAFGRARFVFALAVALAAGLGFDALARRGEGRRGSRLLRAQCVLLLGAVLYGVVDGFQAASALGKVGAVLVNLRVPLLAAAGAAAALAALRRWPAAAALLAIGALGAELQWGAWNFTPASPRSAFYPADPALEALRPDTGPGGGYRFLSPDFSTARPMSAALYDLRDARVAFPAFGRYRDVLAAADPGVFERGRLKTYFTEALDVASPFLDALSVRFVAQPLDAAPPKAGLRLVSTDGWALYERPTARPRLEVAARTVRIDNPEQRLRAMAARAPDGAIVVEGADAPGAPGTARFARDDPDRIEVDVRAEGDSLLVLRDVAAPGWRAEVGGKPAPILYADHAFRGVRVPAGISRVTFRYAPGSLRAGAALSALGLALTGALWASGRRRREESEARP